MDGFSDLALSNDGKELLSLSFDDIFRRWNVEWSSSGGEVCSGKTYLETMAGVQLGQIGVFRSSMDSPISTRG